MAVRRNVHLSLYSILSAMLHVLIWVAVLWEASPQQKDKHENIQVEIVDDQPKPPEIKPEEIVKAPDREQIVEQVKDTKESEKTPDTNFLSEKNQIVKKQTAAQKLLEAGEEEKASTPKKVSAKLPKTQAAKFEPMVVDDLSSQLVSARERTIKDLAPPQEKAVDPEDESDESAKTDSKSQVGQSIDYIKDLDPGTETLLSTKEFKFYTYFARIRRQLNQEWGGRVRGKIKKMYQQGRKIAATDDKVTKLLITLDKTGHLLKAQVIGDSGIRDLDEAAVEAFRAAAPFPAPPDGMVDPDGQVKIRWDFVLEV